MVAVCVLVTYSRVAPHELYHVSHDGLAGGASRALVFLNYPTALMAIAVLALVVDRRRIGWLALVPLSLCLVILVPGVVDEGNLDAKWINVAPAVGGAIVLGLTVWAGIGGLGDPRGDPARIVLASLLGLLALPWLFAELGFYISGPVFQSHEVYQGHATVHLGEHHGFEGYLLVLTALALSRQLPNMHPTWRRIALAAYLSLMIPYGVGNMANDAWYEQVVKRGWTDWRIPGVLRPELTWMWALVIAAGAAIYLAFWRLDRAG